MGWSIDCLTNLLHNKKKSHDFNNCNLLRHFQAISTYFFPLTDTVNIVTTCLTVWLTDWIIDELANLLIHQFLISLTYWHSNYMTQIEHSWTEKVIEN